jgi:hypothetical protein
MGAIMIDRIWEPIIDKCKGCDKVVTQLSFATGAKQGSVYFAPEMQFCTAYMSPASKWRNGNCPLATHVKRTEEDKGFKLNPLKASKRRVKAPAT